MKVQCKKMIKAQTSTQNIDAILILCKVVEIPKNFCVEYLLNYII